MLNLNLNNKIIVLLLVSLTIFSMSVFAFENEAWRTVDVTGEEVEVIEGVQTEWDVVENEEAYKGIEIGTRRTHHEVKFTFTGSNFRWLGSIGPFRGKADIYYNDEHIDTVDLYNETIKNQAIIYEKKLEEGTHTIKIVPAGEKNEKALLETIVIDAFQYIPKLSDTINRAQSKLYEAPEKPENVGDEVVSYYDQEAKDDLIKAIAKARFAKEKGVTGDERLKEVGKLNNSISQFEKGRIEPVFADLSGNNNNAIITEGTPVVIEGVNDKGLKFKNETLKIDYDNIFEVNNFTLSLWFKPEDDVAGHQVLTAKDVNHKNRHWWVDHWANKGNIVVRTTSDGASVHLETSEVYLDNEWHLLTYTYDSDIGEAKLYIDGELKDSKNDLGKPDLQERPIFIGSSGGTRYFNGGIDEFSIWAVTKSQEEINKMAEDGITGNEDDIIGYWNFDEFVDE